MTTSRKPRTPRGCPHTYAASRRFKPFDWHSFLRLKTYTAAQLGRASHLAGEWVTCACGNQCKVIPRHCDGEPKDEQLNRLGMTFYRWIGEMSCVSGIERTAAKRQALTTLARIERRAKVLIRQIESRS